ncbi:unnamed protein product [Mesocestoides corti]|uniref:C3HC-type domain-containing protein n=1 Tax=Mesocestoides corti TaxID=53468 RepID=A0A0R3U4Y2_MESCO|nr:unnamed protein product [Mesocestoides corti]
MSAGTDKCDLEKAENPYALGNAKEVPLSSAFPAFTALNRRRRVTCKSCQLPIGYVGMDMCHIDADLPVTAIESKVSSVEDLLSSFCIETPMNVSLRRGAKRCDGLEVPPTTFVVEASKMNYCEADEIICDGCGACLGARIADFVEKKDGDEGDWRDVDCGVVPKREKRSWWFSFSKDNVDIEPLFGLVGMEELSLWYCGGERYFHEFVPIEESDEYSSNSDTWFKPCDRIEHHSELDKEVANEPWPLFYQDLVRASELPEGTLGHLSGIELAQRDTADAFERMNLTRLVADDSVLTLKECCSDNDNVDGVDDVK